MRNYFFDYITDGLTIIFYSMSTEMVNEAKLIMETAIEAVKKLQELSAYSKYNKLNDFGSC